MDCLYVIKLRVLKLRDFDLYSYSYQGCLSHMKETEGLFCILKNLENIPSMNFVKTTFKDLLKP